MVVEFQVSSPLQNNMLGNYHSLSSSLLNEIMYKPSSEYYKTTTYDASDSTVYDNIMSDSSSIQIMSESNFPEVVKDYLHAEQDFVHKILQESSTLYPNKQLLFIEVGCGKGEYLETICELNNETLSKTSSIIHYFGIDLCPLLVAEGKQRINEKQIQNFAQIECMNVQHLKLDTKSDQLVFMLFPFNLFGNFNSDEMSFIYSHFLQKNCCLMISAYIPNDASRIARKIYYEQCFTRDNLEYYELEMMKESQCVTDETMLITDVGNSQEYQDISHIFYVSEKLRTTAWCENHLVTLMKTVSPVDMHISRLKLTNIACMYVCMSSI